MGDLYIQEGISHVRSIGCYDVVESESFFPLLYNPLAPMDGIFSHLLALTSYISHRLFAFIEDLVLQDVYRYSQDFAVSSQQDQDSATDYGIHLRETSDLNDSMPVYSISATVEKKCNCWGIHFILKGLVLPLCCVRSAWKLASACFRFCFSYVRCARAELMSILFRVRKTLRGSSDDIGWMQNEPGLDPVEDGSARFLELLQATRNGEHKLPDSYVYLLIPGLFSNHGPLYFVSTKRFFSKMGLACHIAKIHSEASVEHNSWVLKQYIEELYWGSGKRVMLLGHSKGGVDAAAALSLYWADLKNKVAGLALVQSPYGGTPIASDILREGQIADKETRRIMELVICKLIKGDIRALEDLTYEKRKEFIAKHKFPKDIPLISFHSEASIGPGVISTLTHIAHAELPWFPFHRFGFEEKDDEVHKVPVVAPVSAAMAISALHLLLRYGEKSDGLVTCRDAEAPGSVVVRPDRKLDHSWMVYSSWRKDPTEPDACEMCEALLTMLVELCETKHNVSMG